MNSKLLIISGPTATGKTDLGIYIARKFNGEIISADSRQVYRGMDILTGKDLNKNSESRIRNSELGIKNNNFSVGYRLKDGIPVWLVDIVEPDYSFNAGVYQKLARKVIYDTHKRGKLPVLVGGTGFYIKSVIDPIDTVSIPPDEKLRHDLSTLDKKSLQQKLEDLDYPKWDNMNDSDRNNPRRLIRAIEVAVYKSKNSQLSKSSVNNLYSIFWAGLETSNKLLYKRIDARVEERLKSGVLEEVKKLLDCGYDGELPSLSATGFSILHKYITGEVIFDEAKRVWQGEEHGFARRQMTWFKKEKRIRWFDIEIPDYKEKIEEQIREWYT